MSNLLTYFLFALLSPHSFVLQLLHVVLEDLHVGAVSLIPNVDYSCMSVAFSTLHCGAYHRKSNGDIMVSCRTDTCTSDSIMFTECNTFILFDLFSQIADQNIIIRIKGNTLTSFQWCSHRIVEKRCPACDLCSGLCRIRLKRKRLHLALVVLSARYPLTA